VSSPIFTPKVQITENAPFETWLRISLGDMPAPAPQDGRGPPQGYDLGETEDYLLFLHPALLLTTTLPYNPTPGDTVTLTVRYNALGNVQAGRVVISDVLQPGLTYVSSDPPGTYNPATRAITWTTSLVPHQPGTVTLTVRLGVGCGVGNTAYLLWGGSIWSRSSVSLDIPGATCMRLPLVLKHW